MSDLVCGLVLPLTDGRVGAALAAAREAGFQYCVTPLSLDASGDVPLAGTELSSQDWSESVIGEALADGPSVDDPAHEAVLMRQAAMAAHLGLPVVLVPGPGAFPVAWGRSLRAAVGQGAPELWVRVAWAAGEAGWLAWHQARVAADYDERIGLCLDLSEGLPDAAELARWVGEPVKALRVPAARFRVDPMGQARLGAELVPVLEALIERNRPVILVAPGVGQGSLELGAHRRWLEGLVSRLDEEADEQRRFERGFYDVLQVPLQPLGEHLSSATYEVFERDPVKYQSYEDATALALQDLASRRPAGTVLRLMVVGAGRGPLVARALAASDRVGVPVHVVALDKNPFAAMTLRHRQRTEWGARASVVEADMRAYSPELPADLLISELLGSFGDNELSPECLDGAQGYLAEDGLCIPESYVSTLAPCSSAVLYARIGLSPPGCERSYVANLNRASLIAPAKRAFSFHHPTELGAPGDNGHNDRYQRLSFVAAHTGVLHGFAGYFDCHLYGGVTLSIHPQTATRRMYAWFPLFFPLRDAPLVREGEEIGLHLWRRHDASRVWYEWALDAPHASSVHNPNGRSDAIRRVI